LRAGSGGTGQWNGGDGLVREIEFLEPQTVSLLGQHRTEGPFGLACGSMGKCGRQTVIRSDGAVEEQKFAAQLEMQPGDRLVIETPGGGGYG
jgi:5-oxoprolinase (ATP-hydrolysing)